MKTIQMTLDDELVDAVDKIVKKLNTSRSAFTRHALREAISKESLNRLEMKHKRGYEKKPVKVTEFSIWEDEQAWGDL
ncbi:MAG: ribbon-helix-helix domain-containing protein [Nitrospiria bacterium]